MLPVVALLSLVKFELFKQFLMSGGQTHYSKARGLAESLGAGEGLGECLVQGSVLR